MSPEQSLTDILEDRRNYRVALMETLNQLQKDLGPDRDFAAYIKGVLARGNQFKEYGPWPRLTDHIARCETCKPVDQYAPGGYKIAGIGENEVVFQLCEGEVSGFALWKRFVDHRVEIKKEAEKAALK